MVEQLWAPWRMEYIKDTRRKKGGEENCIFCDLKTQTPDSKNLVLAKGKQTYVVMNRYPYNCGHLMVVSYDHVGKLKDLAKESYQEILWLISESMEILGDCLEAQGFNCGLNAGRLAGGGIPGHLHWHVVPRWPGDSNFLPILGHTRAMSEYLGDTYKKLEARFKKLEGI